MAGGLITRQPVQPAKLARARQLRRAMTPEEDLLWQRLRANQVRGLHFRRQQVLFGFIVDFFCAAISLVVEVDGAVHDGQREEDEARDEILAAKGLQILRVRNDDVRSDMDSVLRRIATLADHAPFPDKPRSAGERP
ncbi:MAG: endonuclease domain-containing protein [Acidobacteria bacterium]|nr:endonuclease domain-containing protein [Acidobacteriota bacterium]